MYICIMGKLSEKTPELYVACLKNTNANDGKQSLTTHWSDSQITEKFVSIRTASKT